MSILAVWRTRGRRDKSRNSGADR